MYKELKDSCNLIFHMHQNNRDLSVYWTKETYRGKPKNIRAAKDILIQKRIIYVSPSQPSITRLNLYVLDACSLEEAENILIKQKDSPPKLKIT